MLVLVGAAQAAEGPPDHAISVALIAGLALLGGAIITAITAHLRQRQQLNHDAQRQAAELLHDRRTRDLEELRAVLDDAAQAIAAVNSALSRFLTASHSRRPGDPEDHAEAERLHAELYDALQAAVSRQDRIALRIGRDQDVYRKYAKSLSWLSQATMVAEDPMSMADRPKSAAEVLRLADVATEELRAFTEAARAFVGSKLD